MNGTYFMIPAGLIFPKTYNLMYKLIILHLCFEMIFYHFSASLHTSDFNII